MTPLLSLLGDPWGKDDVDNKREPQPGEPDRVAWLQAEIARIEDFLARTRLTPDAYEKAAERLDRYRAELAVTSGPAPGAADVLLSPGVLLAGGLAFLAVAVYAAAARSPYAR